MRNFNYLKKTWAILLTCMIIGLSANATQIPIPSTADSLEHYLEQYTDEWASGDTLVLIDPVYVVNGTMDLYQGVAIIGDPALGVRPEIQLKDNGFRFKQDSIGIIIKGVNFNGSTRDDGKITAYIVRSDNLPVSDSIFTSIIVEDCDAWSIKGGVHLQKAKYAVYDSVIINNCVWGDIIGDWAVDPKICFPTKMVITNSTFYNLSIGFLKNPGFEVIEDGIVKVAKTPTEIIIDHNTFYNIGAGNNALIQINDPKDSTVTFSFTNNIVQKLYDPTNVRPFRINESAGTFDFDYNVIYDFMPTNPDKDQYSLDSTAKQTNVTVTNLLTDDPQLLDGSKGDFRLPVGSALFTADVANGQIGDPRWGVFEGVYIYELQEPVYTNNPVQLEAAIEEVGGATALTWEVDTFYGGTRALATIEPATGLLTPTRAGQVKVTATSDATAVFDTLIVTIQDSIHISAIELIADATTISEVEGDLDITASLTPYNPTDPRVEWSLSDDELADFYVRSDTTIELVAKADGIVTVTATTVDGGLQATIDITIDQFPDGIIAHWKLDETSGTSASDELGESDGTLNNMTDALWVAGLDGNCLDFGSGADTAYVEVEDNDLIDMDSTETFSVSLLISLNEFPTASGQNFFIKGYTSVDAEIGAEGKWYAMETKEGEIRFSVDDNVTKTQLGVDASEIFITDNWAHVVGVRDRALDQMFLYLDGVLIGSALDETNLDISSSLPLIFGNSHNKDNNFPGKIDDFKIYNRALTGEEITAMATAYGISPVTAPVVSDDATLSDLQVDGATVDGFASDNTDYAVELPAGTTTVPTVTATTTHANASAIVTAATGLPGTTTIDVTAEDGIAVKPYKIDFTVAPDGINTVNSSVIEIYPNPATDFIKISVTQQSVVTIHSVVGNVVMNQILEVGDSIDIQDLDNGVYFANISIGDQVRILRFVKE